MMQIRQIFKSKLVKNSMWLFVLQVFNTVLPLVTLPYITRILEPEGYGRFSLALNWTVYVQVIVEYGFNYMGARKAAICDSEELQETFSGILTARAILLLLAFGIMNVAYFLSSMPASHYVCMLLLYLMVVGTAFQLTWLFQGKQDMKFITLVNASDRTISVALVFLLVKKSIHLYRYCFLYSFTYILSSAIGLFIARKRYQLKFRLVPFWRACYQLREGWVLFTSQAMSKLVSGFGVTVLGAVASSTVVGIYSALYKIPYVIVLFFSPISQALYPHISAEFAKSDTVGIRGVWKAAAVLLPLFGGACLFIIGARRFTVNFLFGNAYVVYCDVLIPLCLWTLLGVCNNFLGIQTLVASGHQKEYSRAFVISGTLSVLLYVILGRLRGIYGVAWATFLSEAILTLLLCRTVVPYIRGEMR